MDGMLREQLSQDQLRLLQVIMEPFDQDRGWPVWQYIDLTLDAKFGLDAAALLDSLPLVGYHSPHTRCPDRGRAAVPAASDGAVAGVVPGYGAAHGRRPVEANT
jgi:hypothetical protein